MPKPILLALMATLSVASAAQTTLDLQLSPKLRLFLAGNPSAHQTLTNCFDQTLKNRPIQVYYFYSDDESIPRASHCYPDQRILGFIIRENQEPLDEYVSVLLEVVNLGEEKRFLELWRKADAHKISKSDFVREVQKTEFPAMKKTRDLLMGLNLGTNDVAKSEFYWRLRGIPDDFDEFLRYRKRISPHMDAAKDIERDYDATRKYRH